VRCCGTDPTWRDFDPAKLTRKNELRVCRLLNSFLAAVAKAGNNAAFALPDPAQVNTDGSGVHPVVGGAARQIGDSSAGHHGLSRRAAFVHAGSADVLAFDQRGMPPGLSESDTKRRSTLARANDDGVVGRFFSSWLRLHLIECHHAGLHVVIDVAVKRDHNAYCWSIAMNRLFNDSASVGCAKTPSRSAV
jgi:hypothetical protein